MPSLPLQKSKQIVFSSDVPFNSTSPALSIDPAQQWVGNDGPWSPVLVGVGTPRQFMSLLISTSSNQPWVVLKEFCRNFTGAPLITCERKRGGVFAPTNSSSWNFTGPFTLDSQTNLGINASARLARETVQLGVDGSRAGSFALTNQTVAGIVSKDFWIATWGIRPDTTNMTTLENRVPSLMSNLKSLGKISSLSWGYTAGAIYRYGTHKTSAVSLTLGGTDTSRYQAHNTTFDMVVDPSRDLVVGIRAIKSNITEKSLLPTPFLTLLDAGVSQIWLPKDACQAFEDAFGLTYNETLGLYPVNDTLHEMLQQQNPSITFTLGNDLSSSNATIDITLPYASFDLLLTTDYPGISEPTRYFPLRQADNASQYTLGRTFFQEAYVIADYERSKFSVHQTVFPGITNESLVAIPPPTTADNTQTISTGASVGIALGIIIVITMLLAVLIRWRRKVSTSLQRILPFHIALPPSPPSGMTQQELHGSDGSVEVLGSRPIPPEAASREKEAELDDNSRYELPNGNLNANEMDTSSHEVFELPGSDCATLTDQVEQSSGSESIGDTDVKLRLAEYCVDREIAIGSAASVSSILCTQEVETDPARLQRVASDRSLSDKHQISLLTAVATEADQEEIDAHETVVEGTALSIQDEQCSNNFGTPRFSSPRPMTKDKSANLTNTSKDDPSLCLRDYSLNAHPSNCASEGSQRPCRCSSEISALSPQPIANYLSGNDAGLCTLSERTYSMRKNSIVSPL